MDRILRPGVTLGLCLAALPAAAGRAQAVWTGAAANNSWHTGSNWSTNLEPTASVSATVPAGFPTITALGINAQSINAMSPLTVGGGAIQVAQASSIKDATITGAFIAGGLVTFTGNVTVQAANTWFGAGGFRNTGVLTALSLPMAAATMTNSGSINVPGVFTVGGSSGLILNNGTLELQGVGKLFSSGLVTNNATFRKTGAAVSDVQCRVDQRSGSMEVMEGTLRLTGGAMFNDGAVAVASGATLRLDPPSLIPYTFAGVPQFGGAGDMVLATTVASEANVVADQPFALTGALGLQLMSGGVTVQSLGTLRNQGKISWGTAAVRGPGLMVNEAGAQVQLLASTGPSIGVDLELNNSGLISFGSTLSFSDATLNNLPGGTIALNENGWMTTSGSIHGTVVNQGTVRKSGRLEIDVSEVLTRYDQNAGGVTRIEGGFLYLRGGGVWGPGGGAFEVSNAGTGYCELRVAGGRFTVSAPGHVIRGPAAGPAQAAITGASTVVEVLALGSLLLDVKPNNGVALISGSLGGEGRITNLGLFRWIGRIGVDGRADFHNGPLGETIIDVGGAASLRGTFTNEFGGTVHHGVGLDIANGTVANLGDWFIFMFTSPVQTFGTNGVFRNAGRLIVDDTGAGLTATISTLLDNTGTILVRSGTLNITGQVVQIQGGVLAGGTWETVEGAKLLFPPGVFTEIADANVRGSEATIPELGALTELSGSNLTATGDISVTGSMLIDLGSVFTLEPDADVTVPGGTQLGTSNSVGSYCDMQPVISFQPGPPRLITPTFTVHGTVRPGGPGAAGPFGLVGNLAMMGGGTVQVELGGLVAVESYDRVTVDGSASLGGKLDLKLLPGFLPQLGQAFTVLTATGPVTGGFAEVSQPPGMPPGLALSAGRVGNSIIVTVVPACYANCDGSTIPPVLNVLDFICFLNRYAAGDSLANCDGSSTPPVLNVNDFLCFINAYAAGCT